MDTNIMTVQQACEYLNMKKSYLYKLTSGGVLPYIRPNGGRIYFEREKLETWFKRNQRPGQIEREQVAATYIAVNH